MSIGQKYVEISIVILVQIVHVRGRVKYKMYDLSILIPSRNEMFLGKTIQDIFENSSEKTEVIVVLDGQLPLEPIPDHPRLTLIYHSTSIGQRAATNEAARLSNAYYLMKADAHCAFDKGFDTKMMNDMQDNWTMLPLMKNLHVFNWVCKNGHSRYQSPSGVCRDCGEPTEKDIVWISKNNPRSTAYRFDTTLHFQYWNDYKNKQKGNLVETMSAQGSCFMLTRDKYFELNMSDEKHGSWGQQGTEIACKTWLSGGKLIVNKNTWYAHMFRTQGGDFGFPYANPGIEKARQYSKKLWFENKFDKQIYPLSWLIEKFSPIPDWHDGKDNGVLEQVMNAGKSFKIIK